MGKTKCKFDDFKYFKAVVVIPANTALETDVLLLALSPP